LQVSGPNTVQIVGRRVWQWPKDDGVDDTEDCCIRADAQGQSNESYQSEGPVLKQHADSVAKVLDECLHGFYGFGIWNFVIVNV
jgi:hypothetical protein